MTRSLKFILYSACLFFLVENILKILGLGNQNEAYRGIRSALMVICFYFSILNNLDRNQKRDLFNVLILVLFALARSRLMFTSTVALIFLSSEHIKLGFKKIAGSMSPLAILIPLVIPSRYLNGRGDLYEVFHQSMGWIPKGLGYSSQQVTELVQRIYPASEKTTYIHNLHMELSLDFGFFLYGSLLILFLFYGLKNRFFLTVFIVSYILSFGLTIYSPFVIVMLALGVHFDQTQAYFLIKKKPTSL